MDKDKIELIVKKINILDIDKREHVVKILLTYEIIPKQTNNGAWCRIEELNAEVINVVYDYLLTNLK